MIRVSKLDAHLSKRQAKTDPVSFARLVGVDPDPWQKQVLMSKAPRVLLNCSRQSGKSTTCAILALHQAIYNPKQTILLISPGMRQGAELLRKVSTYLGALRVQPNLVGDSKTIIELDNGSRIVSLPATESTVRGYTANLVIEDEAGDVEDDLHVAIMPMLIVSKGRLILAGTPKGRRGHFFEHWERGSGWEHHRITWEDCPRIPAADVADQKMILREKFKQEYECEFILGGGGMVYGAFDETRNIIDILPRLDQCQSWQYLLGLDFGYTDATAFVVIAYRQNDPTVYVVFSSKEAGLTPSQVGNKVMDLEGLFHFTRIVGDIGGLGKGYVEEMRRRFHLPIEPAEKTNKRGYIDLFNGDLASGTIKFVGGANKDYISEMVSLPWNGDRSKEDGGFDNHLCDAGLYVWRASTSYLLKPKEEMDALPAHLQAQKEVDEFFERDIQRKQNAEAGMDWIFE